MTAVWSLALETYEPAPPIDELNLWLLPVGYRVVAWLLGPWLLKTHAGIFLSQIAERIRTSSNPVISTESPI